MGWNVGVLKEEGLQDGLEKNLIAKNTDDEAKDFDNNHGDRFWLYKNQRYGEFGHLSNFVIG